MLFFIKGLLIGIFVGLPTGPIGFLCIKRTITDGFWAGFLSGAGATLAHVFYGIVVLLGLQHITILFNSHRAEIVLARAFALLILGYIIYRHKNKNTNFVDTKDTKTLFGYFISSAFITLANPIQIISFGVTFAFLNAFTTVTYLHFILIAGILLGSLLCWLILSFYMLQVRYKFSIKNIVTINKITGSVIMCIGLFFLFKDFL